MDTFLADKPADLNSSMDLDKTSSGEGYLGVSEVSKS